MTSVKDEQIGRKCVKYSLSVIIVRADMYCNWQLEWHYRWNDKLHRVVGTDVNDKSIGPSDQISKVDTFEYRSEINCKS